jgi:hypothetical protein
MKALPRPTPEAGSPIWSTSFRYRIGRELASTRWLRALRVMSLARVPDHQVNPCAHLLTQNDGDSG